MEVSVCGAVMQVVGTLISELAMKEAEDFKQHVDICPAPLSNERLVSLNAIFPAKITCAGIEKCGSGKTGQLRFQGGSWGDP